MLHETLQAAIALQAEVDEISAELEKWKGFIRFRDYPSAYIPGTWCTLNPKYIDHSLLRDITVSKLSALLADKQAELSNL